MLKITISDGGDKGQGCHDGCSISVATDDNEDNEVLYPCPSVCQ